MLRETSPKVPAAQPFLQRCRREGDHHLSRGRWYHSEPHRLCFADRVRPGCQRGGELQEVRQKNRPGRLRPDRVQESPRSQPPAAARDSFQVNMLDTFIVDHCMGVPSSLKLSYAERFDVEVLTASPNFRGK